MQTTIRSPAAFRGIGLHSGAAVLMRVLPAAADHGICFRRADVAEGDPVIPARWDRVVPSRLCTLIANDAGHSVSTIEHLMAALAGCGIHNALIEIDGPEVPILDGSSAPFVDRLLARGVHLFKAPVRAIRILEPVEVRDGAAVARLEPADTLEIDFSIEFSEAAIGNQSLFLDMANGTFVRELCDSRTFCRHADVAAMRAGGLARGGNYRNAVVVDGARVLSPGGFRHSDEAVRHKMLDALGDLALAGAPILGRYTGVRAGHALTNTLLRAMFTREAAFRMVVCGGNVGRKLPGAGVSRADLSVAA